MSALKALMKTSKSDRSNFPATNQMHYCWHKYNEYVLCVKNSSGDEDACKSMRQLALSICPDDDIAAWDEQRENGNFLGVQERERAPANHH